MNLTLKDVKAIASARWESPKRLWGLVSWSMTLVVLLSLLFVIHSRLPDKTTYILPDGQEISIQRRDAGEMRIGNTVVKPKEKVDFLPLAFAGGALIAVYLLIFFPVFSDAGARSKYREDFVQHWIETRELPEW